VSSTYIVYTPRPDATPETEAAVLAAVYRFLIDCHAKNKPATGQSVRGDSAPIPAASDSPLGRAE
jgi:hypothetical protein